MFQRQKRNTKIMEKKLWKELEISKVNILLLVEIYIWDSKKIYLGLSCPGGTTLLKCRLLNHQRKPLGTGSRPPKMFTR
jgi:hypothetical protein